MDKFSNYPVRSKQKSVVKTLSDKKTKQKTNSRTGLSMSWFEIMSTKIVDLFNYLWFKCFSTWYLLRVQPLILHGCMNCWLCNSRVVHDALVVYTSKVITKKLKN